MKSYRERDKVPFVRAFVAGASSGACSTILFQPLDVIKTRLQENRIHPIPKHVGPLSTFVYLLRNEGAASLWSGLIPSLWRCVPGVAVYFTTLEVFKSFYFNISDTNRLGPSGALTLGASARSITAAALMPFTVVKTRFESGSYNYKSMFHALSAIYRAEGFSGLMTGLSATLARDVPFSALYFASYTQLKKLAAQETAYHDFTCGLVAGILASFVTQPADVVKTSLQLFPARYHGNPLNALRSIYQSQGFAGFYVGLVPRLVRRTLVASMSWTVYEQAMRSFGLT